VDIHFMDLLIGVVFGQLLKLFVERNTGVVWFEFRGVCWYVDKFFDCNWVDTRWQ